MCDHLLIDGKNLLYRAVYAGSVNNGFKESGHHLINLVLKFVFEYYNKLRPKNVHVFWDSPRSQTWRKSLLPSYKDGRVNIGGTKISDDEIHKSMGNLIEICLALFKNIGIRQYYRDTMEADDLIYAFCKLNNKSDIVIISSDKDLLQISYYYSNVRIHSHLNKNSYFCDVPTFNPVLYKCLVGDKSDNISGYYGVGDVTARVLMEDFNSLSEFFESSKAVCKIDGDVKFIGIDKFKENLKLVDLSLNPYLMDNLIYIMAKQNQDIMFDIDKVNLIISKYKLRGLTVNISRYISPLRKLVEVKNGSSSALC